MYLAATLRDVTIYGVFCIKVQSKKVAVLRIQLFVTCVILIVVVVSHNNYITVVQQDDCVQQKAIERAWTNLYPKVRIHKHPRVLNYFDTLLYL